MYPACYVIDRMAFDLCVRPPWGQTPLSFSLLSRDLLEDVTLTNSEVEKLLCGF